MKRGKLNKAKAILSIIENMEEYANANTNNSDTEFLYKYILKLAEDLKRKKISRTKKRFIRYHPFFDDSVA